MSKADRERSRQNYLAKNPPKPQYIVHVLETDAEEGSSEFYHAWNEDKKRRKQERFSQWEQGGLRLLEERTDIKFRVCTEYHYQAVLPKGLLDFWPSSRRWRYENKTHFGKLEALIGFINKRKGI